MRASALVILLAMLGLLAAPAMASGQGDTRSQAPAAARASLRSRRRRPRSCSGARRTARRFEPDPIGFYSRGCLAGGEQLPVNGPNWQVMRLSRNRNWGHPELVRFLERFSPRAAQASGWPGLLIGDMSQPRGGPMLTGHASHQIGLDADIWLTPMPTRELSRAEREEMSATDVVREDLLDIRPDVWTEGHLALIRAAAMEPKVQRIFVNPAIKRALCRPSEGEAWMRKVRPMWGHNYHFHVRLFCPDGSSCRDQDPTPAGDGCDQSLAWWFTDEALHPRKSGKSWPPMTMAALPAACREVLKAE